MSKDSNQKPKFWFYYQATLAIGSVLVFFTFIDVYFFGIGKLPAPVVSISLFIGAGFLLLVFTRFALLKYIPSELIIWCAGYLAISLFSFLVAVIFYAEYPFVDEAFPEVRIRILSEAFLIIMYLIFAKNPKIQNLTRVAMCLAVLLAVFNNIREVSEPLAFQGLNGSGRAAGYYINPNRTGRALILGMIFGMGVLPKKLRIPFALLVFFGIFLTFSRAAILGWFMVMPIFIQSGVIPRKQFLFWVVGIVTMISVFGPVLSNIDLNELQRAGLINVGIENITGRLEWFQNPLANKEDSGDSRVEVVITAWNMFVEHPILGNGIASTNNLNNWGISTHNMYLLFVAEHGIFGIFILPLFVYAVTWHSRGESKHIALAFSSFILIAGLFTHNIVEERFILICFALMAAMNVTSRLEQKSKNVIFENSIIE
ncbi:O-antigen ligase family protein [Microcoleus sp. C2C3]|uniref:O-antigen ligase family protein n=1 Tax=unclassified Microcoleus TaxID=2642155 RepID=UPI002FD6EEDF